MGLWKRPYVFTEQGVAILSSVLHCNFFQKNGLDGMQASGIIKVTLDIRRYHGCFEAAYEVFACGQTIQKIENQGGHMGKHEDVLRAVFETPTRANIEWRKIEALFKHLGATVTQGRGSRVRVALNDVKAVFHRPRPEKEA